MRTLGYVYVLQLYIYLRKDMYIGVVVQWHLYKYILVYITGHIGVYASIYVYMYI